MINRLKLRSAIWKNTYQLIIYKKKMRPIQNLIRNVEQECSVGESDNIADKIPENQRREFAFACAVITKELDVNISDV